MAASPRYLDLMQAVWSVSSIDVDAIIADVAARLGITTTAAAPAVYAALDYIAADTGLAVLEFPAWDQRLTAFGVPLLAMRMYQDAPNLGGETNNIDPTFAGIYTPARLYSHLDEYWRHLSVNFGVA